MSIFLELPGGSLLSGGGEGPIDGRIPPNQPAAALTDNSLFIFLSEAAGLTLMYEHLVWGISTLLIL